MRGGYYVGAMDSYLFNNVSLLSFFLILTRSVNAFAELPATLFSEHGFDVSIHFKRVLL